MAKNKTVSANKATPKFASKTSMPTGSKMPKKKGC